MKTLALDTSTLFQTVAVLDGDRVLAGRDRDIERGHSSGLLEAIDGCLRDSGLKPYELELVAVGHGPGSFTGLRIGMASAKALAYATQTPIVGVCSLAAMVQGRDFPADTLVVTANDARKGELYAAVFDPVTGTGRPRELVAPCAVAAAALARLIDDLGQPAAGLGNGFALFPEALHNGLGPGLRIRSPEAGRPRAVAIAALGLDRFQTSGPDNPMALEPRYIRKSDAELNFGPPRPSRPAAEPTE